MPASHMGVVTFPHEGSFTAGLARWISPPQAVAAPPAAAEPAGADAEQSDPVTATAASAFETECVALEAKKDFKLLASRLREGIKGRFAVASASDVQNAYAIFFELLVQWQLLTTEAESLADELAESTNELPDLRCTLLLSLYSLAKQYGAVLELRFALLRRLISFCTATGALGKVLGAVEGRVERVERWVREWDLSDAQQKEIWGLVFDAHADDSRVMYDCALKYFSLHDAKDLSSMPALRERIVKGLLITIRSPELFRCDELSQLAVVQQLNSDTVFAPLHRLLHIMARETYAEFLAFSEDAAARSFMEKHDLPLEACATKMRLLTLVSLGHAKKELSYAAVASALHVEPSEVETWVMQAIGNGLITAKMDQVHEVIAVSMCAERDFGQKQWERLHTNLVDWRDSIRSLLTVLQNSRPGA